STAHRPAPLRPIRWRRTGSAPPGSTKPAGEARQTEPESAPTPPRTSAATAGSAVRSRRRVQSVPADAAPATPSLPPSHHSEFDARLRLHALGKRVLDL